MSYDNPPGGPYPSNYGSGAMFQRSVPSEESRQSIVDAEHLRLLRIGYFISAGYTAVFVPFGLLYAGMGLLMAEFPMSSTSSPPPPPFMMWFFGVFGAVFATFALVAAALKFLAATRLKERRSRSLCLIAAGLTCLEIPYGTALGVMTFAVLGRPSVRQLFEPRDATAT